MRLSGAQVDPAPGATYSAPSLAMGALASFFLRVCLGCAFDQLHYWTRLIVLNMNLPGTSLTRLQVGISFSARFLHSDRECLLMNFRFSSAIRSLSRANNIDGLFQLRNSLAKSPQFETETASLKGFQTDK